MNRIDKIKENLNEKQLEAVTTSEGHVRVIAGAGSGKTKALTSRYAYIVEALGISPSNILCVTFTNKAAQEMKKRVSKLIGQFADLSLITTYHGFCVRVLREDINRIQYPGSFIIMDVEDQKSLIRQIFSEKGYSLKNYSFKHVLQFIGLKKNTLEYLDYIIEGSKLFTDTALDEIFQLYLSKQQKNYALDFDDLINFTIYIFNNFPDVLNKWQKRTHYIQIDETQDSSSKQFKLMTQLSEVHKNLFVVGDPDQTIYEWRGAIPEILVNFDKQFPDCRTIIMNQNYRSTPNILDIANQVIRNNKIRVDKDLFTNNTRGIDVVHFHAKSEPEESKWIINEIKSIIKTENAKLREITVLYRAHYISRSIEQALIKENIPYTVYGGIRFFERKEIKDILAYLRLIEIGDDLSFLRIINTPKRGLGKVFVEKLLKLAENEKLSLFDFLSDNIQNFDLKRDGAISFIKLCQSFRERKNSLSVSDLVKVILDETGLEKSIRSDGDEERLENIQELVNSIVLLENEYEEFNMTDYLQEIALYTNKDVKEEDDGKVNLMTIHTSKGLEYPYIFLCGFSDGILPSAMSIRERRKRAIEEERRLTYVALTRAEKRLYITESEGYNFSTGENKYPSRFLFEIKENFYVRKGEIDNLYLSEAKEYLAQEEYQINNSAEFELGDIVVHPAWGVGGIISIDNDKGEYQIDFIKDKFIKPINFEYKLLEKSEKIEDKYEFDKYRKEKLKPENIFTDNNQIDDEDPPF